MIDPKKTLDQFHDARLVSVAYHSEKKISLEFLLETGAEGRLVLLGVVSFFCTSMLEGNIVDSVELLATGDIDSDDRLYFVAKEGRGQTSDQLAQAIQKGELIMLLLSPSYGAELGCVCKTIEMT